MNRREFLIKSAQYAAFGAAGMRVPGMIEAVYAAEKTNTPLRLTPTAEAETVTRLAAGEPARWVRAKGNYVFIRTVRSAGRIERREFGLVCEK